MGLDTESDRDLILLQEIENDPHATQASLANRLGVAIGTINWHLKRLVAKGYVKVRRIERRKLLYIITPEGLTLRANLTIDYIQNSFRLYRLVRERTMEAIRQVKDAGFSAVRLEGQGDVADVCRLTCLEQGLSVVTDGHLPTLQTRDLKIFVQFEEDGMHGLD
jgi:DNA-binding MarR family transcriptional regulator